MLSQRAGAGKLPLRVVDLGCGTGSNLRALAPVLSGEQHWTLVDHDPALLRAARETIAGWASRVIEDGEQLTIDKGGRRIVIDFLQRDLAGELDPLLASPPDLVTAAALFDLVSAQWIAQFCDRVQSVFYTVLTYNGAEQWAPSHAADADVLRAFHAHQTTDKGFGVAAGPGATELLRDRLAARGFSVALAIFFHDHVAEHAVPEGVRGAAAVANPGGEERDSLGSAVGDRHVGGDVGNLSLDGRGLQEVSVKFWINVFRK